MTDIILITGQESIVGSSVYKTFKKKFKIIDCKIKDLNFTTQKLVNNWFKKNIVNITLILFFLKIIYYDLFELTEKISIK
jgi:dTDP-4-dehydrorhamnose reductase